MGNTFFKVLPVALVALVIGVLAGYGLSGVNSESLSKDVAAETAVKFINENMLQAGVEATLGDVVEESGVYKFKLTVNEQEYDSYVTKDGKVLFIEGVDMEKVLKEKEGITEDMPKSKKPVVDLYVMSFCPYGNEAENTMLPVYNLLKDKVEWNMHYIVNANGDTISSLHGQKEVDQNEREACVLKNSGLDAWWKFTTYVNANCGSDGSCWEDAAAATGVDASSISSCVSSNGLALMTQEADASSQAGATGSPTLIINGIKSTAVYQYGNSQTYLNAVCSAFENAPEECNTELSAEGSEIPAGSCE